MVRDGAFSGAIAPLGLLTMRGRAWAIQLKNAGLIAQAGVVLRHKNRRSGDDHSSFLSMFQNIGIAAPWVTPVSDLRQMLGTLYSPSGM